MIKIENDKIISKDDSIIKRNRNGLEIYIKIKKNMTTNLCFLINKENFEQNLKLNLEIGEGIKAKIKNSCILLSKNANHNMLATVILNKNSYLEYYEEHVHNNKQININSKQTINCKPFSKLRTEFKILKGRVGNLNLDYKTILEKNSTADTTIKAIGIKNDKINVNEHVILKGEKSSCIIRTKMALKDQSKSNVVNVIEAYNDSKGHIECNEILTDKSHATTIPKLISHNPKAILTHEASIGKIDEEVLTTLLTKGMNIEEATNFIIKQLVK